MIRVFNPGLYTTLQDQGRFGLRDKGVPVSGCMDEKSAALANALLGNPAHSPVMEITMTGPQLEFEIPCQFTITGALLSPRLRDEALENNKVYQAEAGDRLQFGRLIKGYRAYLAVKGGFDTPKVLGSRSWYYPLTRSGHLQKGDVLTIGEQDEVQVKEKPEDTEVSLTGDVLTVAPGPEFPLLSEMQKGQLQKGIFKVAHENNRMAYQLKEKIYPHEHSILTSATLPGTVQLTPEGKLIILMKDGQTTGGYPRILQLTPEAIRQLSQKKEGDTVIFRFQ